ncbi:MAG: hypothetical protein HY647_01355 [Acidobacteria bacterium]|nr:hypothetical protein [Acidobacteriota bacterium]
MEILDNTTESRWKGLAPALSSLLCLLPIVLLWDRFQALYWFEDNWALISQMQSVTAANWLLQPFGENFFPLFKAFWAAAITLLQGSYFGMILVVWSTHLAILLLLAALLMRCGLRWELASLAVLTLGMSWTNIEMLGGLTQWPAVLSVFFFLLAWVLLLSAESEGGSKWLAGVAVVCALASGLSFPRGWFSGALLAFFVLRSSLGEGRVNRWRLWIAICLASITVGALFAHRWLLPAYSDAFQELNGEKLWAMVSFGAYNLLLNPLFHLLPIPYNAVDLRSLIIAGTCKALIIAMGLWLSKDRPRTLLWTLLLFDLSGAGLLGIRRYNLGITAVVSYRYQYISLLCLAPFLAMLVMRGLQFLSKPTTRRATFAVIFVGWAVWLGYPWGRHIESWSRSRGTDVRNALAVTPPDQPFGVPSITAGRARELIKIYNLH